MQWFYISTDKERVPFAEEDVGLLVHGGTLRPESRVWCEGMGDWLSASEVRPEWFRSARGIGTAVGGRAVAADELDFVRSAAAGLVGSGVACTAAVMALVLVGVLMPIPGVVFWVAAVKLVKARNRLARAEALGLKSAMQEGVVLLRQAIGWSAVGVFLLLFVVIVLGILVLVL